MGIHLVDQFRLVQSVQGLLQGAIHRGVQWNSHSFPATVCEHTINFRVNACSQVEGHGLICDQIRPCSIFCINCLFSSLLSVNNFSLTLSTHFELRAAPVF